MFEIIKVNGKVYPFKLIISILISEGTGILAGFLSRNTMDTYMTLVRPAFSPPGWVFPVVWTILYLLMGIAAYRIWVKGGSLALYYIQLALNFLWPILFFRFDLIFIAFLEILVLWIFIILTTIQFYKVDKTAGYLMVPYLVWVTFAAVLNYFVYKLNKH